MEKALLNETFQRLAKQGERSRKKIAEQAGPWLYTEPGPGRSWGVATDAKRMLWVATTALLMRPNIKPMPKESAKLFGKYFWPEEENLVSVDLTALRTFAGPAVWSEDCPECKGTSRDSDYVVCSFCESDGEITPEARYGWLLGAPIDLTLLAPLLPVFRDDVPFHAVVEKRKPEEKKDDLPPIFFLIQSDRHAVIVGMTPKDKEEWEKAPRFPE